MTENSQQPETSVESAEQAESLSTSRSFYEVVEEEIAKREGSQEDIDTKNEKKVLRRIEASYSMDRLEQKVETQAELSSLRLSVEAYFEGEVDPDAPGLRRGPRDAGRDFSALHSELRREEVEALINTFGDLATILEGVETVDDLAALDAEQLIQLEAKHAGILLYAFTDFVDGRKKIDWAHFDEFYQTPKPGTKLQIDFRGNPSAESELGAGDIFPPAVRCITVYEDGDKQRSRTSVRRIGLKSRNQENQGFFDNDGYMPIYSGDVVVIGGAKNPKKGVDMDYERRYRSAEKDTDGKTEAQKDAEFLDDLQKRHPHARMKKTLTPEDVDHIMESLDTSAAGARAVEMALDMVRKGRPKGRHCWDWVDKVYKRAGLGRRRIYQNLNYSGRDSRPYFEAHPSEKARRDAMVAKIEPGDWLYVNNRNRIDRHGGHSLIVVEVLVPGKKIRVANCRRGGRPGAVNTCDIEDMPVTHITKPYFRG